MCYLSLFFFFQWNVKTVKLNSFATPVCSRIVKVKDSFCTICESVNKRAASTHHASACFCGSVCFIVYSHVEDSCSLHELLSDDKWGVKTMWYLRALLLFFFKFWTDVALWPNEVLKPRWDKHLINSLILNSSIFVYFCYLWSVLEA